MDDEYERHKQQCGQRLKRLRETAELSQMALARLLPGYAESSSISRWERGAHLPDFTMLIALARILEVNPGWLQWGDYLKEPGAEPDQSAR